MTSRPNISVRAPHVTFRATHLRHLPDVVCYHFTTVDVVSRWNVLGVRATVSAMTAEAFLAEVLARMPFSVRAVQVDGGSEFIAAFE